MPTAHLFRNPVVFQQGGTTLTWTLAIGDSQNYYGYSWRPWGANCFVTVTLMTAFSNDMNAHFTAFDVTVSNPRTGGPNGLQFTAIRVPE